ncbi:MAG: hypothetical protein WAN60_08285, partial [Candidatus Sulfotelmatobacter sp.]
MGTPAANSVFGRYSDFVKRLTGDDSPSAGTNVVALFDSLLTELKQIAPVVGRVALTTTGVGDALERMKVLSEIERQLFLQFLEGELTFLRGHRIMKGIEIYRKLNHDEQICQKKQSQISAALIRMLNVEGIDSGFASALAAERIETLKTFIAMKLEPKDTPMMMTVAD